MPCTIRDLVAKLDATNTPVPVPQATVIAEPARLPVFVQCEPDDAFHGLIYSHRSFTTGDDGFWLVILPWPSEQDPALTEWVITLPDGSKWRGLPPEGVDGPLSIHDLKEQYGWGLVSATSRNLVPVAVQGPAGPRGPQGIQGPLGPVGPQGESGIIPITPEDAGKFLTNDGTNQSWGTVDLTPYALQTDLTALNTALTDEIAVLDTDVVHLAGVETITGIKTFSSVINANTGIYSSGSAFSISAGGTAGLSDTGLRVDGSSIYFRAGGNEYLRYLPGLLTPQTNNGLQIGQASQQISTLWVSEVKAYDQPLKFSSNVNQGAASVGYILDTVVSLPGSAKHTSFRDAGAEFAYLRHNSTTHGFSLRSAWGTGIETYDGFLDLLCVGGTRLRVTLNDFTPYYDIGTKLGTVGNRWTEVWTPTVRNSGSLTLKSDVANGASAVGVIVDTDNDITSGKLVSFRQAGTERMSMKWTGGEPYLQSPSGYIRMLNANYSGFGANVNDADIYAGGYALVTVHYAGAGGNVHPWFNGTVDLGLSTNRWGEVWATTLRNTGTLTLKSGAPSGGEGVTVDTDTAWATGNPFMIRTGGNGQAWFNMNEKAWYTGPGGGFFENNGNGFSGSAAGLLFRTQTSGRLVLDMTNLRPTVVDSMNLGTQAYPFRTLNLRYDGVAGFTTTAPVIARFANAGMANGTDTLAQNSGLVVWEGEAWNGSGRSMVRWGMQFRPRYGAWGTDYFVFLTDPQALGFADTFKFSSSGNIITPSGASLAGDNGNSEIGFSPSGGYIYKSGGSYGVYLAQWTSSAWTWNTPHIINLPFAENAEPGLSDPIGLSVRNGGTSSGLTDNLNSPWLELGGHLSNGTTDFYQSVGIQARPLENSSVTLAFGVRAWPQFSHFMESMNFYLSGPGYSAINQPAGTLDIFAANNYGFIRLSSSYSLFSHHSAQLKLHHNNYSPYMVAGGYGLDMGTDAEPFTSLNLDVGMPLGGITNSTTTTKLWLANRRAATAGVPVQNAPRFTMEGRVWEPGSIEVDKNAIVKLHQQMRAVQSGGSAAGFEYAITSELTGSGTYTGVRDVFKITTTAGQGQYDFTFSSPNGVPRINGVLTFESAGYVAILGGAWLVPKVRGGSYCGESGREWGATYSLRYATAQQQLTWSTATPAQITMQDQGDLKRIVMSENVTSWSLAAGFPGERVVLVFEQDGVGGRTLSGAAGNILLSSTFTLSAAAGARTNLVLVYDGANWVEVGRYPVAAFVVDDSGFVHTTGAETIDSTKTFTSTILAPGLDRASAAALSIGGTTATSLILGRAGVNTTINSAAIISGTKKLALVGGAAPVMEFDDSSIFELQTTPAGSIGSGSGVKLLSMSSGGTFQLFPQAGTQSAGSTNSLFAWNSVNRTWTGGTQVTDQAFVKWNGATITFSGSATLALRPALMHIVSMPTVSNGTTQDRTALMITHTLGAGLGPNSGYGITLRNPTAASAGSTRQFSPAICFDSSAWDLGTLAVVQSKWIAVSTPTSANPVAGQLEFSSAEGAADAATSFTVRLRINSNGTLMTTGEIWAASTGNGVLRAAQVNPGAASTAMTLATSTNASSLTVGHSACTTTFNGPIKVGQAAQIATSATAGANGAPPATVEGYIVMIRNDGTTIKVPYYAA